jgi:hypothetical protein
MNRKSARTKAWRVSDDDFYEIESRDEQLEFLLKYAILAPSVHNTQPWAFRITGEGIEVYADGSRAMPVVDPGERELLMSLGAAITNLRVAAAHFGFHASVVYQARPEISLPVALVTFSETSDPDMRLARLFGAIKRRHTNRHAFNGESLDPRAVTALSDLAALFPETLSILLSEFQKQTADLVAFAGRRQMASEGFRNEVADWIRPSDSDRLDGICADALGVPEVASGAAAWLLRHLGISAWRADRDRQLVTKASLLMLVSADDDRTSLVQAGEVLERLLLTITNVGLHYSFMNQPIQVNQLRDRVEMLSGCKRPPQLLLRIGQGAVVDRPMPRRPVTSVVIK